MNDTNKIQNSKKMEAIRSGESFINDRLIYEFIGFKIENLSDDTNKAYLLYKWEEGKVFPSNDTIIKFYNYLNDTPSEIINIKNRLDVIKEEIDSQATSCEEQVGAYFLISAIITLLKAAIILIENNALPWKSIENFYPLVSDLSELCNKNKIKMPRITKADCSEVDIPQMKSSLMVGYDNLEKAANRVSVVQEIIDGLDIQPNFMGIGINLKKIILGIFYRK